MHRERKGMEGNWTRGKEEDEKEDGKGIKQKR